MMSRKNVRGADSESRVYQYRYHAEPKADEFHLVGTVRNLGDGRVEIVCYL